MSAGTQVRALCECCESRPAVTGVSLPGDVVRLCGGCLDDALALGLVDVAGSAR